MLEFFFYELSSLCRGRLAFLGVVAGSLDYFLFRHYKLLRILSESEFRGSRRGNDAPPLQNGRYGIQRALAVLESLGNSILAAIQDVLDLEDQAAALPAQVLDFVLSRFRQPFARVFACAGCQQKSETHANAETYQKPLHSVQNRSPFISITRLSA
jgi:hypothetical protein